MMENFQDSGGTVTVPEVLRPFGAPAATLGGRLAAGTSALRSIPPDRRPGYDRRRCRRRR